MALSFANTAGNLYNRLGRFGKLAHIGRTFQTDLNTYFAALMAQYDSSVASPLQLPMNGVPSIRDSVRQAVVSGYMDQLKANASATVIEMVKADKPTSAGSLANALYEVYLQMVAATATIKKCVVSASAAAASINSGTGVCVVTAKRGDGRDQELLIPESAYVKCLADSQSSGATAGQESFVYMGEVSERTIWGPDYPIGSGRQTTVTAISPNVDGSSGLLYGNLLTNGNFEDFTANLPDNWVAAVGTAGVDFQQSTTTVYAGSKSLQFIGGATNTSLTQTFDLSTGTLGELLPQTSYSVNFWGRTSNVPAAGVLTVDLIDGSGTTINDQQGVANSFTVDLTTIGTTFVPRNSTFRLPKLMPSTVKLRLRLSTALSAGTNFFVDHLGLGRATGAYDGGPGVSVFSGATNFVLNDYFTLTAANDFGGASNLSTFQWLLDRLFNTRALGILMPSDAAPSIADTLITA